LLIRFYCTLVYFYYESIMAKRKFWKTTVVRNHFCKRQEESAETRKLRLLDNCSRIDTKQNQETSSKTKIISAAQPTFTQRTHIQQASGPTIWQIIFTNRDRQMRSRRWTVNTHGNRSEFSYNIEINYINYKDVRIRSMDKMYIFCRSKIKSSEHNGLCCLEGKIRLTLLDNPPEFVKNLLLRLHLLLKHFLENIRNYIMLFQMKSFEARQIKKGNYMPTLKIQRQVYHRICNLLSENDKL